jgi:Protein of unknown function (DUF4054)
MGVVAFNYSQWGTRYPDLASYVNPTLAQAYFGEAQLYCDNTAGSRIKDDTVGGERSILLNMLTAHIAALNAPLNNQPAAPLVGRISGAGQGSVNVQVQNDYEPGTAQWYQQTRYGSAFWSATAKYRTARYIRGPARSVDPFNPFGRA